MVRASSELTEKHLASSIAMGFLRGQQRALSNVGPKAVDAIRQINEVFSPLPPFVPPLSELLGLGDEPDIVFPMIDTAAESLATRRVMTSDDYYRLAANAKQEAFTITADVTENTLAKVRDILGRVATESTSLEQFETLVAAEIGELPISGSHLEQVYRNAVNSAFSQGQNAVLSHPVVEDGFPYRAYYAIHDARARHEHRELESLGLSGTNIYHKDDPVWKEFEPPWSWSCRCGWTSLTIEDAADAGVSHAKAWLAAVERAELDDTFTGRLADYMPQDGWRVSVPDFRPDPKWARGYI